MTLPFRPDSLGAIRDLGALRPQVADSVRSLIAAADSAGVKLTPIETKRSVARQDSLYDQGRGGNPGPVVTWTHNSNHIPGAAVDFMVNGDLSGTDPGYQWLQAHAPDHGFSVLGSRDLGHVEMPSAVPASDSLPPSPSGDPNKARIAANVQTMVAAGATDREIEDYLPTVEHLSPVAAGHPVVPTGHNGKPFVNAPADDDTPGVGSKVLGAVASLNRDIPFAEGAQSLARAVVRGGGWKHLLSHGLDPQGITQGLASVAGSPAYRDARENIHTAEDAAPATATVPARLIGAALSSAVLPGGAIAKGAQYGALAGLGGSDPDANRLLDAALGAGVGGATGAVFAGAGALGRKIPGGAEFAGDVKAAGGRALKLVRGNRPPPVVASPTPSTTIPGLLDSQGSVLEAVKAARQPSPVVTTAPVGAEAAAATESAPWKPRHRTQAQFDHFAERMAQRSAGGAAPDDPQPSLEDLLRMSIKKLGGSPRLVP